jgi:hypothetical protein
LRKILFTLVATALALGALRALPPPNLDRAITSQRSLVQKQPTAERWNDLGNLLQVAGRLDEARDAYEKALAMDPQLATAHYNLGLLLRQAGEAHQAMKHFHAVTEIAPDNAWAWFQIGAMREADHDRSAAIHAYARAYAIDPRLSFTEENPQIVDSKLVTESLLLAGEQRPKAAEAPRAYEEPHHISKLLLPQVPGAPAGATAPAPTQPGQVAAQPPPPTAPATGGQPVLGPQDLHAGAAGAASGSANGGRNPYAGQQPAAQQGDQSYGELLRQRLLEQQQEQEEGQPAEEGQPQVGQPGYGVPVPGGAGYVPEPRSSGELEQRLDLPNVPAGSADQPAH